MASIIVKETAKRILDARKKSGKSAAEVAKAANMARATYYRYESGDQKNMKLDKIQQIAEIIGAYPADLVVWDDEKPDSSDGAGLTEDETELIRVYRSVSPQTRLAMMTLLRSAEADHVARGDGEADR